MVPADPTPEENQFFDLLRQKFDGLETQPPATIWPGVSRTLPPPAPRRWPMGAATVLGLLIGLLVGWWGARQGSGTSLLPPATTVSPVRQTYSAASVATTASVRPAAEPVRPVASARVAVTRPSSAVAVQSRPAHATRPKTPKRHQLPVTTPGGFVRSSTSPVVSDSTQRETDARQATRIRPVVVTLWPKALALDSSIRRASDASTQHALATTQRQVLALLQQQLDSLKQALPAEPPVLVAAPDSLATPRALPNQPHAPQPWAIRLVTESTRAWGTMPGYDPATTRERLTGATTRGAQLERSLGERWRFLGGVGETRVRAQLEYMQERVGEITHLDTVTVNTMEIVHRTDTSILLIREDSIAYLEPRLNGSGQIAGYDTLYRPTSDTTYQLIQSTDTLRRTQQTVQSRVETWREYRLQQLRPEYRFWTIPVAAQVDLLRWRRWRAGLSLGAQVQIFRGGYRPTWQGDVYELRRIGPGGGPFRPVSLAITTGLEVRYGLTERLSLLAGASLRGWAVQPLRGLRGPALVPGAQVGVSWGFGHR